MAKEEDESIVQVERDDDDGTVRFQFAKVLEARGSEILIDCQTTFVQQVKSFSSVYASYARILKILAHDNVLGGVEHDLDVARIGRAGDVVVHHPIGISIHVEELLEKVLHAGVVVVLLTKLGREVSESLLVANVDRLDLLLEQILLVQEQNHTGIGEVSVVTDFLEQIHSLGHAIHRAVLHEDLVVFAQSGDEYYGRDVVKAVDPLLPLVALPADVVHFKALAIDHIPLRHDARRADAGEEHILLRRYVVLGHYSIDLIEIVLDRFDDLIFGSPLPRLLYSGVLP
mmetsp:Transcript_27264/g.63791  ORF Transcript_27264/g.63791 Transcript_27264/m.63791 type:complete len:286 (+) Transcript_27264:642-1499(+)